VQHILYLEHRDWNHRWLIVLRLSSWLARLFRYDGCFVLRASVDPLNLRFNSSVLVSLHFVDHLLQLFVLYLQIHQLLVFTLDIFSV